MSTAHLEPRKPFDDTLAEGLAQHGVPQEYVRNVIEAMGDVLRRPSTALTTSELEFIRAAGVDESVFSRDAEARNAAYEASSMIALDRELRETLLTTTQVCELTGRGDSHIRRLVMQGRLMTAGQLDNESAYPSWQFADGKVLPGIREVIAAFPDDYHPLDIAKVMTEPVDELGGRSPAQWLSSGGKVEPVVKLVEQLSYL